eukprot:318038-Prorocentrum_minimum.AAC.1
MLERLSRLSRGGELALALYFWIGEDRGRSPPAAPPHDKSGPAQRRDCYPRTLHARQNCECHSGRLNTATTAYSRVAVFTLLSVLKRSHPS